MQRSAIIHQVTIGLTILFATLLVFIPVNAKTFALPTPPTPLAPLAAADLPLVDEGMPKLVKGNTANRPRVVPSQLGVCALELIKLEKGRLAVCSDTNLAYSGILLDCADLDGAKAAACEAAMRTMPNQGKRKQALPTTPTK